MLTYAIIIWYANGNKNDNGDNEQTHDLLSFFRNLAVLFILATWTLGDRVAPDQELLAMADIMFILMTILRIAPDCPHWEELVCLVLLRGDIKEGASTDKALVHFEDSLLLVLLLTVFFILSILTLEIIVALEPLFDTNLPPCPGKPPISCRAHQTILLIALIAIWCKTVELVTSTVPTL